jgi:hypothetical protein
VENDETIERVEPRAASKGHPEARREVVEKPGTYIAELVIWDGDEDRAVGCITINITPRACQRRDRKAILRPAAGATVCWR